MAFFHCSLLWTCISYLSSNTCHCYVKHYCIMSFSYIFIYILLSLSDYYCFVYSNNMYKYLAARILSPLFDSTAIIFSAVEHSNSIYWCYHNKNKSFHRFSYSNQVIIYNIHLPKHNLFTNTPYLKWEMCRNLTLSISFRMHGTRKSCPNIYLLPHCEDVYSAGCIYSYGNWSIIYHIPYLYVCWYNIHSPGIFMHSSATHSTQTQVL